MIDFVVPILADHPLAYSPVLVSEKHFGYVYTR